jgi:hypothetical protein
VNTSSFHAPVSEVHNPIGHERTAHVIDNSGQQEESKNVELDQSELTKLTKQDVEFILQNPDMIIGMTNKFKQLDKTIDGMNTHYADSNMTKSDSSGKRLQISDKKDYILNTIKLLNLTDEKTVDPGDVDLKSMKKATVIAIAKELGIQISVGNGSRNNKPVGQLRTEIMTARAEIRATAVPTAKVRQVPTKKKDKTKKVKKT